MMHLPFLRKAGTIVLIFAMLAGAIILSDQVNRNLDENGPERLERAVRQAAVACYSTEGRYPESVDYLIQHYGLRPDSRYSIHYTIFASNLPPEIDITARMPE